MMGVSMKLSTQARPPLPGPTLSTIPDPQILWERDCTETNRMINRLWTKKDKKENPANEKVKFRDIDDDDYKD